MAGNQVARPKLAGAGLLAAWKEYESTFFRMMREKEIGPARVACPAFHCMGGYVHEKLKPYGEKFVKDVPPNEGALVEILKKDKDPKDRAANATAYPSMSTRCARSCVRSTTLRLRSRSMARLRVSSTSQVETDERAGS